MASAIEPGVEEAGRARVGIDDWNDGKTLKDCRYLAGESELPTQGRARITTPYSDATSGRGIALDTQFTSASNHVFKFRLNFLSEGDNRTTSLLPPISPSNSEQKIALAF